MPQRATIDEESGKQDVYAFKASDEQWEGIIEAAEAGVLKLPCCGIVPKVRTPRDRVRHFAHPPYTLEQCSSKEADIDRDSIVIAVATKAEELGWEIVTEAKLSHFFCDLACTRPVSGLRIGFEFETGRRPNRELEELDKGLTEQGLSQIHWFFKKGRKGAIPDVFYQHFYKSTDKKRVEAIVVECERILLNIEGIFKSANATRETCLEAGLEFECQTQGGIPSRVTICDPKSGEKYQVTFDTEGCKIHSPTVLCVPKNLEHGEHVARIQKSLVEVIRKNLAAGHAIWWRGHPKLLEDSFKELRDSIEADEKAKQEVIASRNSASSTNSSQSTTSDNVHPSRPSAVAHQTVRQSDSLKTDYISMRLQGARCLLKDHFGEQFEEALLYNPLPELGSLTAYDIVSTDSQGLETLEIRFGYRDTKTKQPIRTLPSYTL